MIDDLMSIVLSALMFVSVISIGFISGCSSANQEKLLDTCTAANAAALSLAASSPAAASVAQIIQAQCALFTLPTKK